MTRDDVVYVLDSILTELQAINAETNGTLIESELSGIKSELSMIETGLPSRAVLELIDTRLEGIQSSLDRTNDLLRDLLDRLAPPAAAS